VEEEREAMNEAAEEEEEEANEAEEEEEEANEAEEEEEVAWSLISLEAVVASEASVSEAEGVAEAVACFRWCLQLDWRSRLRR
jgi:hypothetical protein